HQATRHVHQLPRPLHRRRSHPPPHLRYHEYQQEYGGHPGGTNDLFHGEIAHLSTSSTRSACQNQARRRACSSRASSSSSRTPSPSASGRRRGASTFQ